MTGLSNGNDAPILQPDICFENAGVLNLQRVGDHRIDCTIRPVTWLCPTPSRITLLPPELTTSP